MPPPECLYNAVPYGWYQADPDPLQLASRLASWDSWGCGGNCVIATGCAHAAGVKACCLISLPSYSSSHVHTRTSGNVRPMHLHNVQALGLKHL